MSTARDETRDGFYMEDGDPSVAQLLHERTFAFSFWPKVGGGFLVFCFVGQRRVGGGYGKSF